MLFHSPARPGAYGPPGGVFKYYEPMERWLEKLGFQEDRFAEQRPLPPVKPGDLLAFATAGAYGAVMSSTYNTRLPAAEVLVRGADFDVVRPRPSYDHIIDLDIIPDWLS